jgi:hypothetical protein
LSVAAIKPTVSTLKIEGITYMYWVKDVGNVLAHLVDPYLKQASADSISKMYKFADVIFGADHGQGSFRAGIKVIIHPSDMLNKEIMEERSIAEIECRKDTLEIVESTLTTPVNNYLQEIVSSVETEEDEQREFDGNITILFDQQQHILYSTFKSVVIKHNDNDTIITTIPFRVSVTAGDLAFYAMFLGKDGMSTKWCWLCKQSYQQWRNLNVDPSQHWTLKSIKDTASTLNNGATELGIKIPPLLTSIHVRMYIIPMLHALIGIVNRLLSIAWILLMTRWKIFLSQFDC